MIFNRISSFNRNENVQPTEGSFQNCLEIEVEKLWEKLFRLATETRDGVLELSSLMWTRASLSSGQSEVQPGG